MDKHFFRRVSPVCGRVLLRRPMLPKAQSPQLPSIIDAGENRKGNASSSGVATKQRRG